MKLYPPSMLPSADGKPSEVIVCADYDNCIFGSQRAAERMKALEDTLHKISQHAIGTKGLNGNADALLKSAVYIARQGLWPRDQSKWTDGPHDDDLHDLAR